MEENRFENYEKVLFNNYIYNENINNSEAYFAFETFTLSVLNDYLLKQGKMLIMPENYGHFFDAFLPDGIDNDETPTYVEVKFTRGEKKIYFKYMEKLCLQIAQSDIKQVLVILGTKFSAPSKESMKKMVQIKSKTNVIIWDLEDLYVRAKEFFPIHNIYLTQPKKAIVEKAISVDKTPVEKTKDKEIKLSCLKNRYKHEDVVLFLGAGISIDAKVPLWNDLINKLLIEMINTKLEKQGKQLSENQLEILVQLAFKNKEESPLTQMRYIRAAFEDEVYNKLIHKILYEKKPQHNTELLKSIAQVCTPRRNHVGVKGIITYNFDDLVEKCLNAKDIQYSVISKETDLTYSERLSIYHVHGYMPKDLSDLTNCANNIIFSEEDYHRVYRDAYCWSNIAQLNYFRENTCFFIGCSLTDPNIRRLLDVAARNGEEPRHYAIMKKKSIFSTSQNASIDDGVLELYKNIDDNIRESFFATLGLNIIWVDEYSEIPEILRWICT